MYTSDLHLWLGDRKGIQSSKYPASAIHKLSVRQDCLEHPASGAQILGVKGSWPMKICKRGQIMFWPSPLKMSHSFLQNCCRISLQVSHHEWRVSKMEDKSNFSRRLKQFDWLTWLTLTPLFYDRSTSPSGLSNLRKISWLNKQTKVVVVHIAK